jgi:hypothetical protein
LTTSNRSKAQLFLEELQRRVYREKDLWLKEINERKKAYREAFEANPFSIYSPEDLAKFSPEDIKYLEGRLRNKANYEPPTPYEDPSTYSIVMNLAENIRQVAPQSLNQLPIQFGTMPTGDINAVTIAVPDSQEHLIVFEDDLFMFCNMMSKIIAKAMPISTIEYPQDRNYANEQHEVKFSVELSDVEKYLQEDDEPLRRFRDVLVSYLAYGRIGKSSPFLIPRHHFRQAQIFRLSMEFFAMGHEYGHVFKGHLHKESRIMRNISGVPVEEAVPYTWDEEYEADAAGVLIMTQVMSKIYEVNISASYAGADMFFTCSDILDRAASILDKGKESIGEDDGSTYLGSHPPHRSRREFMRNGILGMALDHPESYPKQHHENAIKFAESIEKIVELLWQKTKPELYSKHGKMRLDPRWTKNLNN